MQTEILNEMISGRKTDMIGPALTNWEIRLRGRRLCGNCMNHKDIKTKINCTILGEIKYPDYYWCSWYKGKVILNG